MTQNTTSTLDAKFQEHAEASLSPDEQRRRHAAQLLGIPYDRRHHYDVMLARLALGKTAGLGIGDTENPQAALDRQKAELDQFTAYRTLTNRLDPITLEVDEEAPV